jgi:hypothetical protein
MEKQLLIETISFTLNPKQITESVTKSGNLIVEGLLATAEKVNGNG